MKTPLYDGGCQLFTEPTKWHIMEVPPGGRCALRACQRYYSPQADSQPAHCLHTESLFLFQCLKIRRGQSGSSRSESPPPPPPPRLFTDLLHRSAITSCLPSSPFCPNNGGWIGILQSGCRGSHCEEAFLFRTRRSIVPKLTEGMSVCLCERACGWLPLTIIAG